jgi:p-cumate 2,3-dioxygenase beta subunit
MNRPLDPRRCAGVEISASTGRSARLWRLDDWLGLLTGCLLFVPATSRTATTAPLFTIADDIVARCIIRLDPNCHAEFPPSRTRRMITNVRITGVDGDTISVAANFAIFRHRRNEPPREFVGRYRHKLKRTDTGLKIAERRAILDAEELGQLGAVSFLL